jgi:hypothetical protein
LAVAAADRLADLTGKNDPSGLDAVDAVINACLAREAVSVQATVLGWAGGSLAICQLDRALKVLGADWQDGDSWIIRSGCVARLSDPASPRVTESVAALADRTRRQLAAAVLEQGVSIARDPDATLVERTIARLAVHRVRADLDPRSGHTGLQCLLIRGLEQLGDMAAAREVAETALAELPDGNDAREQRIELLKAALRLHGALPDGEDNPVIQQAVALAMTDGAVMGLEARVWAAVNLLNRPDQRDTAFTLANQVRVELASLPGGDVTANQWRVLLAFHAGRAGYPAISHGLLAPVISGGSTSQQEAAQAVLRASGDPQADTRLQIIVLETELAATPQGADYELLRLHHTLAMDYYDLGDYRSALLHGNEEVRLSFRLQGPDHHYTLEARKWSALWTAECGDYAEALRLCRKLLPDQIRVLGRDHPEVLIVRNNIASFTGYCGNSAKALRLCRDLLPDQIRVLGRDHPNVLTTRSNIATRASQCESNAKGLRLCRDLLPDQIRVLGRDHPDVLANRNNIAVLTSRCESNAKGLRLFRELLPDQIRVLGREHPRVLDARSNIAALTGECGDNAKACGFAGSCCLTRSGCWAAITPMS